MREPRAGEEVKFKNSQPESTRAIPEELRLKFLFWNEEYGSDLEKLKSVRENYGLESREYDRLKAKIETKWELPYLPDSAVDGVPFDDPDIPPFCTPVRIKTQRIVDGKKDPRSVRSVSWLPDAKPNDPFCIEDNRTSWGSFSRPSSHPWGQEAQSGFGNLSSRTL